jgi:hypothetical protein
MAKSTETQNTNQNKGQDVNVNKLFEKPEKGENWITNSDVEAMKEHIRANKFYRSIENKASSNYTTIKLAISQILNYNTDKSR